MSSDTSRPLAMVETFAGESRTVPVFADTWHGKICHPPAKFATDESYQIFDQYRGRPLINPLLFLNAQHLTPYLYPVYVWTKQV